MSLMSSLNFMNHTMLYFQFSCWFIKQRFVNYTGYIILIEKWHEYEKLIVGEVKGSYNCLFWSDVPTSACKDCINHENHAWISSLLFKIQPDTSQTQSRSADSYTMCQVLILHQTEVYISKYDGLVKYLLWEQPFHWSLTRAEFTWGSQYQIEAHL